MGAPMSIKALERVVDGLRAICIVLASLLLIGFLASCATAKQPLSDPRQIWCDHSSPRRDATPETPRAELDEINAHNRKGMLWCGWKP